MIMKNIVKKLGLVMALTMLISASVLPGITHAEKATKKQSKKTTVTTYQQTKKNSSKKINGTKNILVIKNNKKKTKAITYPDVIVKDQAITYPEVKKEPGTTYPLEIEDKDYITYPEFLCPMNILPEIFDEDEAYEYLFDVLSGIKKYNMKKHVLEVEDPINWDSEEATEWVFSYGKYIEEEFVPTKYFAVNENGDIFEYSFEDATWYLLAVPYIK